MAENEAETIDDPPITLPNELVLHILSHLSVKELVRVSSVCREWREALVPKAAFHSFRTTKTDLLLRFDAPSSQAVVTSWNFLRLFPTALWESEEEVDEEEFDALGLPLPRRVRHVAVFEFRPWKDVAKRDEEGISEDVANLKPPRNSLPLWLVPQALFVPPSPAPIDQPPEMRPQGIMLLPQTQTGDSPCTPLRLSFSGWEKLAKEVKVTFGRVPPPPGSSAFSLAHERVFLLPEAATDRRKRNFGDFDIRIDYEDLPPTILGDHTYRTLKVVSTQMTISFFNLGFSSVRNPPPAMPSRSTQELWKNRIRLPRALSSGPSARVIELMRHVERRGLEGWIIFKFEFARRYVAGMPSNTRPGEDSCESIAALVAAAERSEAHRRGDWGLVDRIDKHRIIEEAKAAEGWVGWMLKLMKGFWS